jgi:hypothetical protein
MCCDRHAAIADPVEAGAPEITSVMIDAGARALRSFDPLDWCEGYITAEDLAVAVLRAIFSPSL